MKTSAPALESRLGQDSLGLARSLGNALGASCPPKGILGLLSLCAVGLLMAFCAVLAARWVTGYIGSIN